MKIGPVDFGQEHRGGSWDMGVRLFPGCVFIIGLVIIFRVHIGPLLLQFIDKHAAISILLFILTAYACGHILGAATDSLGKWTDAVDKGDILAELLKENSSNSCASMLRDTVEEYVLGGRKGLIESDPNEVYYLCVHFLRHRAVHLYDQYASRMYWVAELRLSLGMILLYLTPFSLFVYGLQIKLPQIISPLVLVIAGILLLRRAIKGRRFLVKSVLRAVFTIVEEMKSNSRKKNNSN